MVRKILCGAAAVTFLALGLVLISGCSQSNDKKGPSGDDKTPEAKGKGGTLGTDKKLDKKDEEHAHKPGAHGGIMVEIGRDLYHAEAVFEKGGVLRLYTLGADETKVIDVENQTLTAYAKLVEGGMDSESFEMKAVTQSGDAQGKTSRFSGRLPREMWGKKVEVTIPSIRIAGDRFRIGFSNATVAHAEEQMPGGLSGEEETKLYLTPGGKYTEADIKANENRTASQKFKGVMASHDLKPKAGDKICPITLTKANPKFTWVVGGKTYEFCCPPCVDEFVLTAKTKPEEIKEPGDFVKKK